MNNIETNPTSQQIEEKISSLLENFHSTIDSVNRLQETCANLLLENTKHYQLEVLNRLDAIEKKLEQFHHEPTQWKQGQKMSDRMFFFSICNKSTVTEELIIRFHWGNAPIRRKKVSLTREKKWNRCQQIYLRLSNNWIFNEWNRTFLSTPSDAFLSSFNQFDQICREISSFILDDYQS